MLQANLTRQFISSLKTQHGIICPDCKQEIAHVCFSIESPSLQQPTALYEHHPSSTSTSSHLSLPPHCASHGNQVTAQVLSVVPGNLPYNAPRPAQPPRSNPVISSTSTSHSAQSYSISVPPLPFASKTGISSFSLSSTLTSSKSVNTQCIPPSSCLGKRNVTDLDCESEIKRARWSESSQSCTTSVCPSPAKASEPLPLTTTSSRSTPAPITLEDRPSIEEMPENWCITYNENVPKAVDVRLACALHVEQNFRVRCLKFSKDGKYLAVGFDGNGATSIYDVHTGQKSWLVSFF